MIIPVSIGVGDITSTVVPWFELNTPVSRWASSMSSNRLSTQKW